MLWKRKNILLLALNLVFLITFLFLFFYIYRSNNPIFHTKFSHFQGYDQSENTTTPFSYFNFSLFSLSISKVFYFPQRNLNSNFIALVNPSEYHGILQSLKHYTNFTYLTNFEEKYIPHCSIIGQSSKRSAIITCYASSTLLPLFQRAIYESLKTWVNITIINVDFYTANSFSSILPEQCFISSKLDFLYYIHSRYDSNFWHWYIELVVPFFHSLRKNEHLSNDHSVYVQTPNIYAIQATSKVALPQIFPHLIFNSLSNTCYYIESVQIGLEPKSPYIGNTTKPAAEYILQNFNIGLRVLSSKNLIVLNLLMICREKTHTRQTSNQDELRNSVIEVEKQINQLTHTFSLKLLVNEYKVDQAASFQEILDVFYNADILFAVHGAVFANLFFMHPQSYVIEFYPCRFFSHKKLQYRSIAQSLQLHYQGFDQLNCTDAPTHWYLVKYVTVQVDEFKTILISAVKTVLATKYGNKSQQMLAIDG